MDLFLLALKMGDSVWVLQGCSVPLVLRRDSNQEVHTLFDEAYVHDSMNGKAFDGGFEISEVVMG